MVHSSPWVLSKDESSFREEMVPFSTGTAVMLAAGEPVDSSPSAFAGKHGLHCPGSERVLHPLGTVTALAITITTLYATVYISARILMFSLLRHSKWLPRAVIMASTNSVATPSSIAITTSLVAPKPPPINTSL